MLTEMTFKVQSPGYQFGFTPPPGSLLPSQCTLSGPGWSATASMVYTTTPPYTIFPLGMTLRINDDSITLRHGQKTAADGIDSVNPSSSTYNTTAAAAIADINFASFTLRCPGYYLRRTHGLDPILTYLTIAISLVATSDHPDFVDKPLAPVVQFYHLEPHPFPLKKFLFIVIGSSAGGLTLVAAIIALLCCFCKRKNPQSNLDDLGLDDDPRAKLVNLNAQGSMLSEGLMNNNPREFV